MRAKKGQIHCNLRSWKSQVPCNFFPGLTNPEINSMKNQGNISHLKLNHGHMHCNYKKCKYRVEKYSLKKDFHFDKIALEDHTIICPSLSTILSYFSEAVFLKRLLSLLFLYSLLSVLMSNCTFLIIHWISSHEFTIWEKHYQIVFTSFVKEGNHPSFNPDLRSWFSL